MYIDSYDIDKVAKKFAYDIMYKYYRKSHNVRYINGKPYSRKPGNKITSQVEKLLNPVQEKYYNNDNSDKLTSMLISKLKERKGI